MTGNWGGGCRGSEQRKERETGREERRRERKRQKEREIERGGGQERCTAREALGVKEEKGRERDGGREQGREAVIKSDCIASRMSQESRISGDVKPCLTPQLDNCGCGS